MSPREGGRLTTGDRGWIAVLSGLALFVWCRDTSWMAKADDTLPILVTLPLFVWLGQPWRLREVGEPLVQSLVVAGVLAMLGGIMIDVTFLLAAGWVLLLSAWTEARVEKGDLPRVRRLMIFPLLAFPWVVLDGKLIGWWFRLSGAWVTAGFFELTGREAEAIGTSILIDGFSVEVEEACAGIGALQSMLIAGSMAAYFILGDSPRYWWNVAMLVPLAWMANVARILGLSTVALVFGPQYAEGLYHTWGGAFILCVMFGICLVIFSIQRRTDVDEVL